LKEALPEPASVRALLLDAGGVIVRPSFSRVARALADRGVNVEAGALEAAEAHAKRQLDVPAGTSLETDELRGWRYFDLVLERAGIARSVATEGALAELKAWHDVHNAWEEVPAGVREALSLLRASGRRLAVVSNANGTVELLLRRLGLAAAFDAVLDSAVERIEKPDPRLFERALERLGVPRQATLHVGDMYHIDVVGARAAGLRAVLVDSDGLYPDADCPRVPSLLALAEHLCAAGGSR
jgi:putative hydrolase of the HAD superfamily